MKAKDLLSNVAEAEKNASVKVETIIKKNVKFLERKISDISRQIEDKEEEIEKRISSEVLIDNSVVEVTFRQLYELHENKELYERFLEEYYTEEGRLEYDSTTSTLSRA